MMQAGELAGCVVTDEFIRRLGTEKKPERLERAALMVAAVKDLGFAGAHIGGFGLAHRDFMTILERAQDIGKDWRKRIDELVFEYPGEFHLLPPGKDGLSEGSGEYQVTRIKPRASLKLRFSQFVHRHLIAEDSFGARFFAKRLKSDPGGLWSKLLEPSSLYRKAALGCMSCGDCIQEHLSYASCSMRLLSISPFNRRKEAYTSLPPLEPLRVRCFPRVETHYSQDTPKTAILLFQRAPLREALNFIRNWSDLSSGEQVTCLESFSETSAPATTLRLAKPWSPCAMPPLGGRGCACPLSLT
jgi:hypothetical protein